MKQFAKHKDGSQSISRFWFGALSSAAVCASLFFGGAGSWQPHVAVAAPFPDKADDDFNLAVGFFRAKRWDLAGEAFAKFLDEHPSHARHNLSRMYLGLVFSAQENYAGARTQFQQYIEDASEGDNLAEARYRVAECSYYLKDYKQAVPQFRQYLSQHSGHKLNDWGLLFLGDSHNATAEWQQAAVALSTLITEHADSPLVTEATFGLGRASEGLNDLAEAMRRYQEVVAAKDDQFGPRALARMGTLHFHEERYQEAANLYDLLVQQFPTSSLAPAASLNSGLAHSRMENRAEALARFRAVPANSTGYGQAQYLSGTTLREMNQPEDARNAFTAALEAAGESPLATDILWQRAQLERQDNQKQLAAQMFRDIAARWPQDDRAPVCLLNAVELLLELDDTSTAETVWQQLSTRYAQQSMQPRQQVLHGRLLLDQGKLPDAIDELRAALKGLTAPQAAAETELTLTARYLLIRALFDSEQFGAVVAEAQTALPELQKTTSGPGRTLLIFAANASIQLGQATDALAFADQYLAISPDRNREPNALIIRTKALARLKRFPEADADILLLTTDFADLPATADAILDAADAALRQQDYSRATALYQWAAMHKTSDRTREAGLQGVAWSYFEAEDFAKAQDAFKQLATSFPATENFAQTIHMQALCADQGGQSDAAAALHTDVFNTLAGDAVHGALDAEKIPPLKYAFASGRSAAILLTQIGQPEQADAMWQRVIRQFPAAAGMDSLLNERAILNVNLQRYDVADDIFRQLLTQYPESRYAGGARFSLAESELHEGHIEQALAEMRAIVGNPAYADFDHERAMFQLVQIHSLYRSEWKETLTVGSQFLTSWPESQWAPQITLLVGDAHLNDGNPQAAIDLLTPLRTSLIAATRTNGNANKPIPAELDRLWVTLAEASLLLSKYAEIDQLASELAELKPPAAIRLQMQFVEARRYKQQAPPDFEKARELFRQVIDGDKSPTRNLAIKSQFQIAESLLLQQSAEHPEILADARMEYMKVYITYTGHDEERARALYQAARCDVSLNNFAQARRSYEDLIRDFPESPFAVRATQDLEKLGTSGSD